MGTRSARLLPHFKNSTFMIGIIPASKNCLAAERVLVQFKNDVRVNGRASL